METFRNLFPVIFPILAGVLLFLFWHLRRGMAFKKGKDTEKPIHPY